MKLFEHVRKNLGKKLGKPKYLYMSNTLTLPCLVHTVKITKILNGSNTSNVSVHYYFHTSDELMKVDNKREKAHDDTDCNR